MSERKRLSEISTWTFREEQTKLKRQSVCDLYT
ncbi:hypothetical protein GBAR_LOCUS9860, partial [Geodia barretti]